jgi:hypothetical protein
MLSADAGLNASLPPPPPPLMGLFGYGGLSNGNHANSVHAQTASSRIAELLVKFGRMTRVASTAHVTDARSWSIIAWFAVLRVMALWILLFAADRVYQSSYVERGLGAPKINGDHDDADDQLPRLWTLMPMVLLCEALFVGFIFLMLSALRSLYGGASRFVLDADLMSRILYAYLISTAILAIFGAVVGNIVQCRKEFRYREDGLRAIRSLCVLLLPIAIIVILLLSVQAMF